MSLDDFRAIQGMQGFGTHTHQHHLHWELGSAHRSSSQEKLLAWCMICNGKIKYNSKIQFVVERGSLSCPVPSGIDCVVCVERT